MSWRERKKIENSKFVSLGGKVQPPLGAEDLRSHSPVSHRTFVSNLLSYPVGSHLKQQFHFPICRPQEPEITFKSVARPRMKKQKEREQKMLHERVILGQFGGKFRGSSKKSAGKRKPVNRGLKSSEGCFRNGILDVKHL